MVARNATPKIIHGVCNAKSHEALCLRLLLACSAFDSFIRLSVLYDTLSRVNLVRLFPQGYKQSLERMQDSYTFLTLNLATARISISQQPS